MDRLLKRSQRVHPAAFCSRDLFLLHDNAPAHKAASIWQFLTPKIVTNIYQHRTLQIYLRQTYFLFPMLKMAFKGLDFADVAEIQEADERKNVQKEEFSAAFQKLYDSAKPVYMPMELILNKNVCVLVICFRFLKNHSQNFGPLCVSLKVVVCNLIHPFIRDFNTNRS
jgi:hypothetical protein